VEQLVAAHRTARRLGARPLVERLTGRLADLGEQAERRLGRRAVVQVANGGLTRREVEVVRLVAMGHTNREIARELFLSPRHRRDARRQYPGQARLPLPRRRRPPGQRARPADRCWLTTGPVFYPTPPGARTGRPSEGRSHSDPAVGCMVWSTTASSSAVKVSRSTSWRSRALKAAMVWAAS
jgi:hypothetical protein